MFGKRWWIVAVLAASGGHALAQDQPQRARLEFSLEGGVAVLQADEFVRQGGAYEAEGKVVITYQDLTLRAHRVIYDPVTKIAILRSSDSASREVELTRGLEWLKANHADVDVEARTGTFYDVDGFTDQELFVRARSITKTGPTTYVTNDGILTSCAEALPKWSLTLSGAKINTQSWVSSRNTVFRIKSVPVFYMPYLIFPSGQRRRQTGFLLPSTGNASNKGRRVSQSFYLTLGESADLTYTLDHFSKRGPGHGFVFRARPNHFTNLVLDGYAISDRLNQGGASLNGEGETLIGGFRAVAKFNLVSSFEFRQVFSDNFFNAVRPTDSSQLFVTKNRGPLSFNFTTFREETAFPGPNTIVRAFPSFQFKVSGQRLGKTPLLLDLDASAAGLNREDSRIETPGLTQRLDLFPRLYFSVPVGQGLKLTPQIGVRQTYYSASLETDSLGERRVSGQSLSRHYLDFTLDLAGWGLSKIFRKEDGTPKFKHLIEPAVRYRFVSGIDAFDRVFRFDEHDAIADTNEVEVAVFNRFFVKRGGQTYEWLSIKIAQKYFFDSDFGEALQDGRPNQFFPLYTLTGFQYAAFPRNSSPLTTVVRISPRRQVSFDVRSDYDTHFDEVRNLSLTGSFSLGQVYLGTTYYLTQMLEPGTVRRHQLQQQFSWGRLEKGFSLSGLYSYDMESSRFLNYRGRVNYFWDCCGLSFEVQAFSLGGDDGARVRDERQFLFSFYLKGIGFFGNIERPDRVF